MTTVSLPIAAQFAPILPHLPPVPAQFARIVRQFPRTRAIGPVLAEFASVFPAFPPVLPQFPTILSTFLPNGPLSVVVRCRRPGGEECCRRSECPDEPVHATSGGSLCAVDTLDVLC